MERSTSENVKGGYIKLYRSAMRDTDTLWELGQRTGDFRPYAAWTLVLAHTHFAEMPRIVYVWGCPVSVERGHFLMSQADMAIRLGCTRQNVRTILKMLVKLARIQPKGHPKVGLYKVCNWETYNDDTMLATPRPNQWANQSPTIDPPTYKNEKNMNSTSTSETGVSDRYPSGVPEKQCDGVVAGWNALASKHGLLTARRRKALLAGLRDPDWRGSWAAALAEIPKSAFLLGETGRDSWKGANFDFFVRPDTVDKILEGQYEGGRAAREPMFPDVL